MTLPQSFSSDSRANWEMKSFETFGHFGSLPTKGHPNFSLLKSTNKVDFVWAGQMADSPSVLLPRQFLPCNERKKEKNFI